MTLGLPVDRLIETRKWALDWALNAMGGINNGNVWSIVDAARSVADYLLESLHVDSFSEEPAQIGEFIFPLGPLGSEAESRFRPAGQDQSGDPVDGPGRGGHR